MKSQAKQRKKLGPAGVVAFVEPGSTSSRMTSGREVLLVAAFFVLGGGCFDGEPAGDEVGDAETLAFLGIVGILALEDLRAVVWILITFST